MGVTKETHTHIHPHIQTHIHVTDVQKSILHLKRFFSITRILHFLFLCIDIDSDNKGDRTA